EARQVPPEDPYYEQAQADIRRWGRVILDLAEGRAASGDIGGAIAAARLVPEDQPELNTLAQQRIQTWEQRIGNQTLIQQAQNSLLPGQASSYNNAIEALRQIQPDQPGYADARERIRQWSEDILAIARARAAQGDLGGAIGAARLVPEDSDAYGPAQEEIQRWQAQ
ncbi:MAG: peptidase C14, partial [Cyanobacteria bacterium P01_H01_bin.153]